MPLPSAIIADDVAPGAVAPAQADTTITSTQIRLDNWKKAGFYLTDKEVMDIDRNAGFVPLQMSEAIRALANAVNASVHAEYVGVYGMVGLPGTTPFVGSFQDATEARKLLNKQLAPRGDRRAVLDFDAEANALALPQFSDADKVGDSGVKIEGEIGRKFGIDWFADDGVMTHVAGTAADDSSYAISVASDASAGVASIVLDSDVGSPTLVVGDVLAFDGMPGTYVVTEAATLDTSGVSVSISPALAGSVSASTGVAVAKDHVVNLAFHRDAFALAMRPLTAGTLDLSLGNQIVSMTDETTGLSLRLEVSRQYKQTVWEFDVLWGTKLVRPELACRIAG